MYLWIKVLHIAAIISWMCGVLYLYRILINIVDHAAKGPQVREVLTGMASRLYRLITMPAMGVSYIAGITMLVMQPELLQLGAMHVKLTFVLALTVSTIYAGRLMKKVVRGEAEQLPKAKTLRILNEVPTLLMLVILAMIVVRPF